MKRIEVLLCQGSVALASDSDSSSPFSAAYNEPGNIGIAVPSGIGNRCCPDSGVLQSPLLPTLVLFGQNQFVRLTYVNAVFHQGDYVTAATSSGGVTYFSLKSGRNSNVPTITTHTCPFVLTLYVYCAENATRSNSLQLNGRRETGRRRKSCNP